MKEKSAISLLGCGWLGFPLATSLISAGYRVKASTTSPGKLNILTGSGIDPYLVQFSSSAPAPDIKKMLEAGTLIIAMPPGRKAAGGFDSYKLMIEAISKEVPESIIEKVILISSTSVYPENNTIMHEDADVDPITDSGKLMAESEVLLTDLPVKVIVLRLAGLIGPQRMPGKFFSGKTKIPNGLAPVNLIHRNDVIRVIMCLIENDHASGIYNACAPSHPSRTEFYTLAARTENLEPPHFIPEKRNWKIVSSQRIERELSFIFEFPSLTQFLQNYKGFCQ
ncbi:MAG: Rossmann-fold NAD(P)-binding domain-containing protein [Daejeonella sp.]